MREPVQPLPQTLSQLAERLGGRVAGAGERTVSAVKALAQAGAGEISFVVSGRFLDQASASGAGVLLVDEGMSSDPRIAGRDLLVVDPEQGLPVNLAMARLVALLHPQPPTEPGVHPTAVIGSACRIDAAAYLGPYVVVGDGSRIGAGCALHAHAVVGRHCALGSGVVLHPHAVLYDEVELEAGVTVHAGAVVGADGFGYATHDGVHHKVPQIGRVVLERDVEVGANAAIDRATLGETRLGAGTKVDNLVQVGHNVRTGQACILCGQSGIAGSTTLGDAVVLGGQAGIADHLQVGDGVQVAAKSALFESAEGGARGGIPAIDLRKWRRLTAVSSRLAEMFRRLRAVERRLDDAEKAESAEISNPGNSKAEPSGQGG